jgi:uncharacterized protein (TIGR02145 family)
VANPGTVGGIFVNGEDMTTTSSTVSFTITNNGLTVVGPVSFTSAASIGTGGTATFSPAAAVTESTDYSGVTINPGDSAVLTYNLTGTPSSIGTLVVDFNGTGGLTSTVTATVNTDDAIFSLPHTEYFVSLTDGSGIVIQGVITNGDTFTIPYTSGLGSYAFYTTPTQNLPQEVTVGGARDISLSWGPNSFSSSGDLIVNINVSGGGSSYAVPAQLGGATSVFGTFDLNINGNNKGSINLKAIGACAVDDGAGGSYLFLCHNLGADTSLEPHTPVVGLQGGYIKWGLQGPPNWVGADNNGSLGFAAAPTASDPNTDVAIGDWGISIVKNGAWNNGTEDDPVKDTNNDPCPVGFRVPTRTEWKGVIENNTESTTGTFNSDDSMYGSAYHYGPNGTTKLLTLPAAGRHAKSGYSYNRGETCYYWSSSESENSNDDSYYYRGNNVVNSGYRGEAFSVRCIAE